MKKIDRKELKEYITKNPKAELYFGCDSTRLRKKDGWLARYIVVAVVRNGPNDTKVFGEVSWEKDYDKEFSKPSMRMMNEVFKVSSLVLEIQDVLVDRKFEIHLDINTDVVHGSSVALQQAVGYIKGVNGIDPKVKPEAWASSCVADHFLKEGFK